MSISKHPCTSEPLQLSNLTSHQLLPEELFQPLRARWYDIPQSNLIRAVPLEGLIYHPLYRADNKDGGPTAQYLTDPSCSRRVKTRTIILCQFIDVNFSLKLLNDQVVHHRKGSNNHPLSSLLSNPTPVPTLQLLHPWVVQPTLYHSLPTPGAWT